MNKLAIPFRRFSCYIITIKKYSEEMKMEYVTLSNGVKMPRLGYGVYQVGKAECERCVLDALKVGYRHLDTAQTYFNEEEVGNAIQKSGIPREEIFITTKVWVEHYGYEQTKKSVYESMRKLQVDYIDLVLLHQPFSDYYGAWRALEDMYAEGKIKAIGISNFYPDRMVDLASFARIKPMVNQVETHPFNQQIEAQKWMEKYGIQIEAWAPFGEGRGGLFTNETIAKIAAKYNKSVAQVILRWELQRGIVVIPKSVHIERMEENFNVFDFKLSEEDMATMATLDKNQSLFFSHTDPNMVEWFVQMVEERQRNHDHGKDKKNR
jgi:2,5-diketo-D-gluconate reductase A